MMFCLQVMCESDIYIAVDQLITSGILVLLNDSKNRKIVRTLHEACPNAIASSVRL